MDDELRIKLTWLTVFRTVTTTLLLLAIGLRSLSSPQVEELSTADRLSFLLIGGVYALTIGYGVVLRFGWIGRGVAYAQVMGDVLLATCLVYLTGGTESPFTFTYSIAIIAASILLHQRGALIAAAASALAFIALGVAAHWQLLRPLMSTGTSSTPRVAFILGSNALAQFLIAVLASYLARMLSAAGGRLSAREADLEKLIGLQQEIVSAMPSGLITCERDGAVTFINPAACSILGLPRDGRAPVKIQEVIPDALSLGPHARRAELSVQTPMGERTLGLAVTPLEGERGALLVVFQDLTDLRRVEEELVRADRLASLGKLSAQLAHEIRNPLAAMRGSAQLLASEVGKDSAGEKLLGIIVREADRLAGLVDSILKYSRPPPPVFAPVELRGLVSETLAMLRADPLARGVVLEEDLVPARVRGDAGQLRQLLINLVRNALVAVRGSGRVRVSVRDGGETARLSIWDSAGSIPAANLSRLFEPFFTTREGGAGLGLSTSHSIVTAHEGKIYVTSSPEQGTEFVVLLPAPRLAEVPPPRT